MSDIPVSTDAAQRCLHQFLQENTVPLLGIIRSYVVRMGLAHGDAVQVVASDVLHDTVIEALRHVDRFDPTTQPMAWFLAIAANMLKRKKAAISKRRQHEILMSDLVPQSPLVSESDMFDQIIALSQPGPEGDMEANEQARAILSLVSLDDQKILRLTILHDLNMNALAQSLGISAGAARVRFHRALNRLRAAWNSEKGEHDAQ